MTQTSAKVAPALALLDEGFVTVREAVTITRFSRSKLYELMQDRQLAYVRVGRSRRIPRRSLARLIEKGLVPAAE